MLSMLSIASVSIVGHTTASIPKPHILYSLQVVSKEETKFHISKRYSEFDALRNILGPSSGSLPPKRNLITTFVPSAWVDDNLIFERTLGLQAYLEGVINNDAFCNHPALADFLGGNSKLLDTMTLEDVLPSTLTREEACGVEATATYIAAAYYPDWVSSTNPPESLEYSKFDILYFAFAMPSSTFGLSWGSGSQPILKRLVIAAKSSGYPTKVVLSVGGWFGCAYFSKAMNNSTNRATLVQACVDAVNTFMLDGIDIDWEYPNNPGAGNTYSSADAANLLKFFQSLRAALGTCKLISAAVAHQPWLGTNGRPLTNVSEYAAVLDTVNIMNYDVYGASANPGPNAPLGDLCNKSRYPEANAYAAFAAWTAAGFPAGKLLLGIPLYGYVSKSSKTVLVDSVTAQVAKEDCGVLKGAHARPVPPPAASSSVAPGDLSAYWGQQIAFKDILRLGALKPKGDGTYVPANGYTMGWHDCSDTPYLFNVSRTTVVTYDDTYSLGDKAKFAKNNKMSGCFTWSLDQDDGYVLQNVIRSKLGKTT